MSLSLLHQARAKPGPMPVQGRDEANHGLDPDAVQTLSSRRLLRMIMDSSYIFFSSSALVSEVFRNWRESMLGVANTWPLWQTHGYNA